MGVFVIRGHGHCSREPIFTDRAKYPLEIEEDAEMVNFPGTTVCSFRLVLA